MEKAAEADQAADKIENSNKTNNEVRKMDWLKSIISVVVGIAAVLIIWRVGFVPEPPISGQAEKPTETKVAAEAEKSVEAEKPDAADKPEVASEAGKPEKPGDVAGTPPKAVAAGDSGKPDEIGRAHV